MGGVEIPSGRGLAGHSDADVLVHALVDALLGAAVLGDIGSHFPDTDSKWKGVRSLEMLKDVAAMLGAEGWLVNNVDCTVVAQEPRLAPYISEMRESLAGALNLEVGRISIKAKTTEGMGFVGTGQGMEAHVVASVVRNPVK